MLGLAAKYGLRDVREGLSTIRHTVRSERSVVDVLICRRVVD